MASDDGSTLLVVSAHAADFVWRAGGAVALHAARGTRVHVVCLSFGERGESAKLWREPGMTVDRVKAVRRAEAERAAAILGCELSFFDLGDYPLVMDEAALLRLADLIREVRPSAILTHSQADPYNADHPRTTARVQEARIIAQAHGHDPSTDVIGTPEVFLFEPHQPERCGWSPDVFLDITPVWDKKRAAFETMAAQEHLWDYYTRVAEQRGAQARRNSGRNVRYAEAYERIFPVVTETLV